MAVKVVNNTGKPFVPMKKNILMDQELGLRERGMMATLLSLPPEWEFSAKGMAAILPDGVDAVNASLKKLESRGYVTRIQERDENGRFLGTMLIINSVPDTLPLPELPSEVFPETDEPSSEIPLTENPAQLNNKESNNQEINIKEINIHQSGECSTQDYREKLEEVKQQIDYDAVTADRPMDIKFADTIVQLMAEVYLSGKKEIKVMGENLPAEVVKARLRTLTFSNVEYVIDCIKETDSSIANPRSYLLTSLYNAPEYEDLYWTTMANKACRA